MFAAHSVVVLEMADHGLDGGAATHLAADGLGETTDLTTDPDLEAVRIVVAAMTLVAVDVAHGDIRQLFEDGDDGTERVAVIRVACSALACSTNCPPFGMVTGATIETLRPNS
jgi:hypothetical protein